MVGDSGAHDCPLFCPCFLRPRLFPVKLKDGTEVLIRKAGPEDFPMLYLMFSSVSGETMFRRFRMSNKELGARDVREMLRLEDQNVTSVIAILRKGDEELAVGEARYVADWAHRVAEGSVVIADDLQNRGLGTALLSDLVAEGRRQGLKSIFAYFDIDNRAIIQVGQKVGFRLALTEGRPDYSMMKAEVELSPLRSSLW